MTILDNLWHFLQLFTILKKLTILAIFYNFDNVDIFDKLWPLWHWLQFWQLRTRIHDNPWDLWPLGHWLQFWQLRTWIHEIFVTWQLIVTLDSIRNSCDVLLVFFNIYRLVLQNISIDFCIVNVVFSLSHSLFRYTKLDLTSCSLSQGDLKSTNLPN